MFKSKLKKKLSSKNSGLRHEIVTAPDFDNEKFMVFEPLIGDWLSYLSVVRKLNEESSENNEEEKAKKLIEAEAKLFIKCVRDEKGEFIFTNEELPDLINAYGNSHSRLLNIALDLFQLNKNPIKEAEKK